MARTERPPFAPYELGQPGRPVEVHGQVASVQAHLARRAAHADHACTRTAQQHSQLLVPFRSQDCSSRHAVSGMHCPRLPETYEFVPYSPSTPSPCSATGPAVPCPLPAHPHHAVPLVQRCHAPASIPSPCSATGPAVPCPLPAKCHHAAPQASRAQAAARTRQAEGGRGRRARQEDAVHLARPHERLLEQLALRVLAAVEQPLTLALAQRHRRRRPVCRERAFLRYPSVNSSIKATHPSQNKSSQ